MKIEENIQVALTHCPICSAIPHEHLLNSLKNVEFQKKSFKKGEIIAHQGDNFEHLHILTKGTIRTKMASEEGEEIEIEIINAPKPFASAFLFAQKNSFPVEVESIAESEIIMIPKDVILKLFQENLNFLQQFLTFNANKAKFLSQKLNILTIKSIKGKISFYILEELAAVQKKEPHQNSFQMRRNQTQLAAYFGVSRPALARSFSQLKNEGIIAAKANRVTVLNIDKLRSILAAL
ncbi:MAG: Crp/Fnr family transcriptional regulator [Bacteroidales bacterium]